MDQDLDNGVDINNWDSASAVDFGDGILRFGGDSQVKVIVKKPQSEFNPLYASPVKKSVDHSNCMFIIVHESEVGKNDSPLFTANTDELTDGQYASYLEFSKQASKEFYPDRPKLLNEPEKNLNLGESERLN